LHELALSFASERDRFSEKGGREMIEDWMLMFWLSLYWFYLMAIYYELSKIRKLLEVKVFEE